MVAAAPTTITTTMDMVCFILNLSAFVSCETPGVSYIEVIAQSVSVEGIISVKDIDKDNYSFAQQLILRKMPPWHIDNACLV